MYLYLYIRPQRAHPRTAVNALLSLSLSLSFSRSTSHSRDFPLLTSLHQRYTNSAPTHSVDSARGVRTVSFAFSHSFHGQLSENTCAIKSFGKSASRVLHHFSSFLPVDDRRRSKCEWEMITDAWLVLASIAAVSDSAGAKKMRYQCTMTWASYGGKSRLVHRADVESECL